MAGPVFSGSIHSTIRLYGVAAETVGANGLPGFSSVTVTVTSTVSVSNLPPGSVTSSLKLSTTSAVSSRGAVKVGLTTSRDDRATRSPRY